MPYVKSGDGRREALRRGETALTAGELNYQLFYYIKHNWDKYDNDGEFIKFKIEGFVNQFLGEKPNYQKYNDMTGALIRCYRELQRRFGIIEDVLIDVMNNFDDEIAQYEDRKIIENGDVE